MASDAAKDTAVAKDAIGLREVLSQSVTHMAPAAAVALSIPAGAYAARALPLSTLLALVACLFVLISGITYYWRFQRQDATSVLHGMVPVFGIAAFVPAVLAAGERNGTYPSSLGWSGRRDPFAGWTRQSHLLERDTPKALGRDRRDSRRQSSVGASRPEFKLTKWRTCTPLHAEQVKL